MALAIKVIPTLHGEAAKKFEEAATKVENNPGTQDFREKAKLVKAYLKNINL